MPDTQPVTPEELRATPELEDFAHKYTDEGNGKIGSRLIDNYFRSVEELFNRTELALRPSFAAVEIGCGEGFSTQRIDSFMPDQAVFKASEYVEAMIPKAQANNPHVPILHESAYELQHEDESLDVVFLLEVLEHLDYPAQALEEIARVLKPDGYLILGVPREPLWCMLNMARGKYLKNFGNTPGHLNHWGQRSLKVYMEDCFGPVQAMEAPLPWTIVLAQKQSD